MNITQTDIDMFSKRVADDYLTRGTPLNDSIIKVASENGLNKEQISRIVENANTEVYTTLFNKTASKYVEFPNADSAVVHKQVFADDTIELSKAAERLSDYQDEPMEKLADDGTSIFKIDNTIPSPIATSPDELYRQYTKVASVNSKIEDELEGLELQFQDSTEDLFNMIKQAVLGGAEYGDIRNAITSVHSDRIIEITCDEIEQRLSVNMPTRKFEKTAMLKNTVNANHPLIKQATKIVKLAEEFVKIKDKQKELASEWEQVKTAAGPNGTMSARIMKALGGPLRHPGIFAAGAVAGGIAVPAALATANTAKNKRENSPLNTLPPGYRP